MQQQDNHEYPFLYQRQTCHQVQPNQATYQKRQKCQPATYLQERSEERFSRNAETDIVCRLLLEKKKAKWLWNGVWKDHFIPSNSYKTSDLFKPNEFASGKVAMARVMLWFTCCLGDLKAFFF